MGFWEEFDREEPTPWAVAEAARCSLAILAKMGAVELEAEWDDIASESIFAMHEARERVDPQAWRGWLFRSLRWGVASRRRRFARREALSSGKASQPTSTEPDALSHIMVAEILDKLPKLSPRLHQSVELLLRGVSPKDAAREMGVADATYRGYLGSARAKLAALLREGCDEGR